MKILNLFQFDMYLLVLLFHNCFFGVALNPISSVMGSKHISLHHRGFESFTENNILVLLHSSQIEGKLPDDLRVLVFINGAGRNDNKGEPYGHWFDGDGLVTKIAIDGKLGKIEVRSR